MNKNSEYFFYFFLVIYFKWNFFSFEFIKNEIYDRAKDYAKDQNKVKVYFEIGKILSEAGKEYGKNIIKQYSERLVLEVDKKYNERNLRYEIFLWSLFKHKMEPSGFQIVLESLSKYNSKNLYFYLIVSWIF